MMTPDKTFVTSFLQMHRQELRSWGVVRLGLFGSFVRGGEGPESDVDVFVEFAPGKKGLRPLWNWRPGSRPSLPS